MIEFHLFPKEQPPENGNYIVVEEFDGDVIVETDYWWFGKWDDDSDFSTVIAWAKLPTLEEFKKELGVSDDMDSV